MSITNDIFIISKYHIGNIASYARLFYNYWKKHNPIVGMYISTVNNVRSLLASNKKLKVARYRVFHLKYRLQQMEALIDDNNPNNKNKGTNINIIR